MPGFQFVHVETYARKADAHGVSTGFVFDEAERVPGSCSHVENPAPPVVVFGCTVAEVRALHDERAAAAVATTKAGKSRKVRVDQHTLLTAVVSHPASLSEVASDPARAAEVDAWQARSVEWLRRTWGDELVSVVRHDDEDHVHLHAYVVPSEGADMRARSLHPGVVAKDQAVRDVAPGVDAKAANRIGDAAYKEAMRGLQDGFFEAVGMPSGLARLGPGRRRLSRDGWQAEQAAVASVSVALAAAEVAQAEVDQAKADAASVQGAAQHQAAVIVSEAEARAAELAARGRAFVERANRSAAEAVAAADAAEVHRASAETRAACIVADAERRAEAVIAAAHDQVVEILAVARSELARLGALGTRVGSVVAAAFGQSPARVAARLAPVIREEVETAAAVVVEAVRDDLALERQRVRDVEKTAAALRASVAGLVGERDRAQTELAALRGRRSDRSDARTLG